MATRLVRLDGDRRLGATRLGDAELVIGRGGDADLVLRSADVSRHHALVEPYEDGYSIRDLGSANGTRVNGYPITDPVLLSSGDVVEVGNVTLLCEDVSELRIWGPWIGGAVALVLAVAAAVVLRPQDRGEDVLEEAAALAQQAVEASRSGDAQEVKDKLDLAFSLMFSRGLLDDVPERQRETALRTLQGRLSESVDLVALYSASIESAREPPPITPGTLPRGLCRLDRVSAADIDACVFDRAVLVLQALWQKPENIPEEFYDAVVEQLRLLLTNRRDWVEQSLDRGRELWPMMDAEFEAAKMPPMLRYLSMIESGYQPKIRSPAGARGLWQFMPATGRAYGLRVDAKVDERTDPRKSTRAAARYLRDLAFEFGGDALLLAIASYNKGENGMRRALKKMDDPRADRSYWALVENNLIPLETRQYVPRLVAAAVLGEAGVPSTDVVPRSK